jgi:hypothetical protein
LAAQGRSPTANRRPDSVGQVARVKCVLTLDGLVESVAAGRAPATIAGEFEAEHPPLL